MIARNNNNCLQDNEIFGIYEGLKNNYTCEKFKHLKGNRFQKPWNRLKG